MLMVFFPQRRLGIFHCDKLHKRIDDRWAKKLNSCRNILKDWHIKLTIDSVKVVFLNKMC